MKVSTLFLIVFAFCTTSVLSMNNIQIDSISCSALKSATNNEISVQYHEGFSDSTKVDSAKVQVVKADTAKFMSSGHNQLAIEKGKYMLNGKVIKKKEYKELLNSVPESAIEYKKAQAQITYEIITLIGIEVVLIATTGYYIGAIPCVLIAIPFGIAANKHEKEAIRLYNLKQGGGDLSTTPISEIPKVEKTINPELKKVDITTSKQLNVGDIVSFYSFQTNTTIKGTIIQIKDKTVIVEYTLFNKKQTSEQQTYDVKKVK
ncbi:MAG: hypothetical protein PHR83_18165 [Paludibacter sp.]|nr:hypothetical protein [Paludibacter sp.]